jgi:hypothetical protein
MAAADFTAIEHAHVLDREVDVDTLRLAQVPYLSGGHD